MGQFVERYMRGKEDSFQYSRASVQVYPLSMANKYIHAPTALFRAQYNFLLFFEAGGGEQEVDNENLQLKLNDVLFVREGHLNAIKSIAPDTAGFYVYFDSSIIRQIFPTTTLLDTCTFTPKQTISSNEMRWVCSCCRLMQDVLSSDMNATASVTVPLLAAIVARLSPDWSSSASRADRQTKIAASFRHLLYDHFLIHRDIGFYAEALAVSENYLTRCLKSVTGRSAKAHINETVIAHSKILLHDEDKDISEIAFSLNFDDPPYFGRLFRQMTGQSPSEYRVTLRKQRSPERQP